MTIKLELTPDVQAGLLSQAQTYGLSLEEYAENVLRDQAFHSSTPSLIRSQLAGQRVRELRKSVTLGGLSIRELIDEDRD